MTTLGCNACLLVLAIIIRALKLIRLSNLVDLITPPSRVLFYVLCIPPPCNVVDRESALPLKWVRRLPSFPSRVFNVFTLSPWFLLTRAIPPRKALRPPVIGVSVLSIPSRLPKCVLRLVCPVLVL